MTGDPSRRPPAGWLPHPRLALLLAVLWLLLQNVALFPVALGVMSAWS